MPQKSAIEWTDYTSNPIRVAGGGWGCTKVSPGCAHCYAERLNLRFGNKRGFHQKHWDFVLDEKELDKLLRLKAPVGSRVFVGDMIDLFHEDVPDEFLDRLYAVFAMRQDLIFQVLTKRPARRLRYWTATARLSTIMGRWPRRNVHEGVSIEDQATADERVPILMATPAAVRFVSYEPAIGPWDCVQTWRNGAVVDWVIAGGESGPKARPSHPDWFRRVRDQCAAAGVPYFFKQWGEWIGTGQVVEHPQYDRVIHRWPDRKISSRVGKKAAGRLLDGREHNEFPNPARAAGEG